MSNEKTRKAASSLELFINMEISGRQFVGDRSTLLGPWPLKIDVSKYASKEDLPAVVHEATKDYFKPGWKVQYDDNKKRLTILPSLRERSIYPTFGEVIQTFKKAYSEIRQR